MLDFFAIFSKSGIVLFTTVNPALNTVVNKLIRDILLEEKAGICGKYQTDQLQLQYAIENEFEMVFVVGYQRLVTLKYVDKFLTDMQKALRDRYPNFDLNVCHNELAKHMKQEGIYSLDYCDLVVNLNHCLLTSLVKDFDAIYKTFVGPQNVTAKPEIMRTFQDSAKSKKTVASMIVTKETKKPPAVEKKQAKKEKKGKAARQWDLGGTNAEEFDFSKKSDNIEDGDSAKLGQKEKNTLNLKPEDVEVNLQMTDQESSDEDEEYQQVPNGKMTDDVVAKQSSYFNAFKNYISLSKKLKKEDLKPVMEQLRDHLTSKNVAAEISEKLCESVCSQLEGQTVDSWTSLSKFARNSLEEVVLRILNPNRSINILREIQAKKNPPYVIVFCGVNGVGKSTNLAKIANWLINNKVKVLVVACDTFRAGAIEQLKTHVQALKSIHERGKNAPINIELFDKGYNRDAAGIAMDGIKYAKANQFNCVLVDTAGRMQDNEPLMKQLAKLIVVNQPDLTLFVGEALVGNEAVDQLTKFNQSLINAGCIGSFSDSKSAINGIVLTKFDTIDDQVGAAISMTYVTGQPIIFVGVGQTYKDLKQLDAKAVTRALMR